jgi:hypothetical protein
MAKWKLFLKTLPWVAGVLAIALLRDYVLHLKGFVEFGDVSPLLPAIALIIGFMLAGVLVDYKESERMPGEIATELETIGDTVQVVIALNKEADASQLEPRFRALVSTVEDFFMRRNGVNRCYAALDDFRQVAPTMQEAAGTLYSIRCLGEMHNLRRLITRTDVISRTSFVPVGYALLDLLVGISLILMLASSYKTPLAEYSLIALFSLIYIYLLLLIRDMDEPFGYAPQQDIRGSAEVDPYPLREYRQRCEAQMNDDHETQNQ